jgi:hypothetical protein
MFAPGSSPVKVQSEILEIILLRKVDVVSTGKNSLCSNIFRGLLKKP